jgi:glycosyltransferase involved in cell wall biosynthesis
MKLSIITINLNYAEGLKKTIQSVINQTFNDYEYIIIDGGSTDGSVDIIKQYADKINYWISETDKGIYNAMNKGILKANGEYCQFLNSGDTLVDNNILKKVFDENLQEDIIYGNVFRLSKNGVLSLANIPDKWTLIKFLNETISHSAAFIKRQLFSEVSLYDETLNIVSDWVFFVISIIIYNKSYIHVPYCISNYENWGVSSDLNKCYLEKLLFFSKDPYTRLLFQSILELQIEIENIHNSKNYRLRQIILYPLRKIKCILKFIMKKLLF